MIYILFLFLTILFAVPRVFLPRENDKVEPHYSVKYSFGWEETVKEDNAPTAKPLNQEESLEEDSLELENWMFEPGDWKINDES